MRVSKSGSLSNRLHRPGWTSRLKDGIKVASDLSNARAGKFSLDSWYATIEGGAYGISNHSASTIALDKSGNGRTLLLADADAVAGWVRTQFAALPANDGFLKRRLTELCKLSIYPGYFSLTDSEERRCSVISAYIEGLKEISGNAYGSVFADRVDLWFRSSPEDPRILHTFKCLPLKVAGMLAGHGILYKEAWGRRRITAIVEGWRYQLSHSADKYILFADAFEGAAAFEGKPMKPLIFVCPPSDQRTMLCRTGLNKSEVTLACVLADGIAPDDGHLHAEMILQYLLRRSNMVDRQQAGLPPLPEQLI